MPRPRRRPRPPGPLRRCVPGRAYLRTDGAMLLDDALARTATRSAFVRLHDIIARVPGLIGAAITAGGGATGDPEEQSATDGLSVSVVERRRAARRGVDEEHAGLLAQAQEALAQAGEALAQAGEAQ